MFLSKMRFYSIGVVAENKEQSTHDIRVVPVEAVPLMDGEILDTLETLSIEGQTRDEKTYTVQVKASATVGASWLPVGSNRVTSPDVRRGEKVMIWQFADVDKFYWTPLGTDDDLRRLETVVWAFSATADDGEELELGRNMYTIEVSTHDKHFTIHTTQANGEPFEYTIQLNTDYGKFFVTDNEGNSVELDSKERIIRAINSDDTEVKLDKKTIYAFAKDLIEFKSMGELKGYVKKRAEVECDGPYIARAPEMQFGEDDAVEPSVLGDTHGEDHAELEKMINESQVIGNLGAPTSAIQAMRVINIPSIKKGGGSYSKVNKNQ